MSYMGVRTTKLSHVITAKLHGPIDTLVINPMALKQYVRSFFNETTEKPFNLVDTANDLSQLLADQFCDGISILWTEVTVQSPEDIIYSAVAERIPINV